jgi:hypothetical protein
MGPSLWISLEHKPPPYDTKMLLKVVFDKTVFVKFLLVITFNKTLMKHISKNQKSIGKSIPVYGC